MSKNRKFLLGIIVFCLVLLGGGLWLFLRNSSIEVSFPSFLKRGKSKAEYQSFVNTALFYVNKATRFTGDCDGEYRTMFPEPSTVHTFDDFQYSLDATKERLTNYEELCKTDLVWGTVYKDPILDSAVACYNDGVQQLEKIPQLYLELDDKMSMQVKDCKNSGSWAPLNIRSLGMSSYSAQSEEIGRNVGKRFRWVLETCSWLIAKYDLVYETKGILVTPTPEMIAEQKGRSRPFHRNSVGDL